MLCACAVALRNTCSCIAAMSGSENQDDVFEEDEEEEETDDGEEEEDDDSEFSDPEGYVDDITDEGIYILVS